MKHCEHCARRDQEALDQAIGRMKGHAMSIETTMTAYQLANDAIGLFLEYRDVHGMDEDQARLHAATETADGIQAEVELRANGEIR